MEINGHPKKVYITSGAIIDDTNKTPVFETDIVAIEVKPCL